jgi:Intracellular sensor of Lambda phage, Abi component
MKLSYYHYYFKQRRVRGANRIVHSIEPFLKAFVDYPDVKWKKGFVGDDGETTMLLPTAKPHVYMLIATRRQDIIKAVDTQTLLAEDLANRLHKNEETGFAAYIRPGSSKMALASTLRAPRTAAFTQFVNQVLDSLKVTEYRFHVQSLTTQVTLEQAKALAYVSATSLTLEPGNGFRQQIIDYFSLDDDVGTIQVVIKGKPRRNIADMLDNIEKANDDGMTKFVVRGRAVADEQMTDYFIEGDGRYSEELESGSEKKIISGLSKKFAEADKADELLNAIIEGNQYDEDPIPALSVLDTSASWGGILADGPADSGL